MTGSPKFFDKWQQAPDRTWMLVLAAIVFLANIQIYLVQILIQDDYYFCIFRWHELGSPPSVFTEGFSYLNRLLCWIGGNVDLYLARSIVVVGILIPSSLLLFRILRKLDYPVPVVFFTAALIWFIPGQTDLPVFINASYHAEALFILLIAFWCGLMFLQDSETLKWHWYVFAMLMFFWSLHVSELVVPSAIAISICFLFWRHFKKKSLFLAGSVALLAFYHTYFNILHNSSHGAVQLSKGWSFKSFYVVLHDFAFWCLPVTTIPWIDGQRLAIFFFLICGAFVGTVVMLFRGSSAEPEATLFKASRYGWRGEYLWRVLFPVVWCLSTLMVMGASPWFRPRHAIFPAIGLYLFLSLTFYEAFKKYKKVTSSLMVLVLIVLALQYFMNADIKNFPANRLNKEFIEFTQQKNYPPKAQIVVVGMFVETHGFWQWSTGYLRYMLKRNDVSGIVGDEFMFSNPFRPAVYTEGGMNGLNLEDPLFLYRRTARGFEQLTYFLQWIENNMNSEFALYQIDPATGKISKLMEGTGMADYLKAVSVFARRGVNRSDIMWGGESSDEDKQRLGAATVAKEKGGIRGMAKDLVKVDGYRVSGGTLEKGGLGYVLSSEKDKIAVALKKTDMPFKNIVKIKAQIKNTLPSGPRNGFILFGESPGELSKAAILIGGKSLAIEGPFVQKTKKPQEFGEKKVFDTELIINLSEKTVTWKVDGTEVKTRMTARPASINYIGYAVWSTQTEFSELHFAGN